MFADEYSIQSGRTDWTAMHIEDIDDNDCKFTLQETHRLIEHINNGLNVALGDAELRTMLACMLSGCGTIKIDVSSFTLFRARYLHDPEIPFPKLSDMMAPPDEIVSAYGRCNKPGQSVFYGANNMNTMFAELRAKAGDHIQYVELRTVKNQSIMSGFSGFLDYFRRYGAAPHMIGDSDSITGLIKQIQNDLPREEWVKSLLVDAFVADHFRREVVLGESDRNYNLTAAFTNFNFEQENDAIVYPSVAHLGGWNMAIKPQISLERLGIMSSGIYRIQEYLGYGLYSAKLINYSESVSPAGFNWSN